ncbi:RNA polymerase sigma factor SigJ [Gordonia sp. CPCC 206044]|uniref:RNA polymerase sigma factor SigJ n=1 Tax=Gordonia sp. CPCC 206044 TaxID=3140793 RepID=UPI003AF3E3E7
MDVVSVFDDLRPRLIGVAYGLLGSVADAEDVVQDAWIRLQRTDPAGIDDVTGWLVTTTSRLALDVLRSARVRRENYVGPWLPEPVETAPDPADSVSLADTLSWAMLVVLETLTPAERAAFVLHDVFGLSFDEIATALDRNPATCRKLASRARAHVEARQPRFTVDPEAHRRVVTAFAEATATGDLAGLLAVLDPDAVLTADGGGVVFVAPEPVHGAQAIGRFLAGLAGGPAKTMRVTTVNHNPALLVFVDGVLDGVAALGIVDGRIATIDFVRNPHKLGGVSPLNSN